IQFDSLSAGGGGFDFGSFGAGAGLGGGPTAFNFPPINLDVHLEARDTFLIRNEQINTVSSVAVYLGGTLNEPDISGRATLETGTLNSEDLMRSGMGTAASLLSNEFISQPLGQEAERLLGINRFQIDPVLRPNANPAARLTIGRQIARNLSLTYSTNLATEQD